MSKNYTSKVQFTGYLDTNRSEWEGVTKHHVKEAIDDMNEEELRSWLKRNFDTVLNSFEKSDH